MIGAAFSGGKKTCLQVWSRWKQVHRRRVRYFERVRRNTEKIQCKGDLSFLDGPEGTILNFNYLDLAKILSQ